MNYLNKVTYLDILVTVRILKELRIIAKRFTHILCSICQKIHDKFIY